MERRWQCRRGLLMCHIGWVHMGPYRLSHISSFADPPSPARHHIPSQLLEPSDPSVPVAVTSTQPVQGQCHPQLRFMSSLDAPCIQGPKSNASLCPMTRWTGVTACHSIVQSTTLTHQCWRNQCGLIQKLGEWLICSALRHRLCYILNGVYICWWLIYFKSIYVIF